MVPSVIPDLGPSKDGQTPGRASRLVQATAPMQAQRLSQLDPLIWQTCELIQLGYSSFGATTSNVAESTGFKLLTRPPGKLSIRESSPGDCILRLCELLCEQSTKERDHENL